jgi:hypothetical protein
MLAQAAGAQGVGVLCRAHAGGRRSGAAWWACSCCAACCRGIRDCDGRTRRRRAEGSDLAIPLTLAGGLFVLLQILAPLHQAISANLGDRTAAWLYDRLTAPASPAGIGHLEIPPSPPTSSCARLRPRHDRAAVDRLDGLHRRQPRHDGRRRRCTLLLFGFAWWAPLVLGGGWLATHWLLRESAVWRDRNTDEVRSAQRDADYAYRLAVDPAREGTARVRLGGWTIARFSTAHPLHALQYAATRLRERPLAGALCLVARANVVVFWASRGSAAEGRSPSAGS